MTYPRFSLTALRSLSTTLLIVGGLLFALTAYGAETGNGIGAFDIAARDWAADRQSPLQTAILQPITDIGAPLTVAVATIIIAALWVIRSRADVRPRLLFSAVAFGLAATAVVKSATERMRPTVTDLISHPGGISYSFPSGHAIGTAILLLTLSYFLVKSSVAYRYKVIGITAAAIFIALVGYSRLYLGYHWLTDILASYGLSLIILALVIIAYRHLRRQSISSSASL